MYQQILAWQSISGQLIDNCLSFATNQVDIWQADLNLTSAVLQELQVTLSQDEKDRADRFYSPQDKNCYIAARGLLRSILSKYLHTSPRQIKFTYTPQGKPFIELFVGNVNEKNGRDYIKNNIEFNLSHSQGLVLYAFREDQPLGIDLEYDRPLPEDLALAKRWFLPSEYQQILEIQEQGDREQTFFRFWTAKEAYIKATGVGLRDLSTVEITITPENSLQFKTINGSQELAQKWDAPYEEISCHATSD